MNWAIDRLAGVHVYAVYVVFAGCTRRIRDGYTAYSVVVYAYTLD
jgi:hypothetical protein